MKKFKILSLDGGGTWALLQVRALQLIYGPSVKGHEVLKDFDLVAANSGGSITAVQESEFDSRNSAARSPQEGTLILSGTLYHT